MRSLAATLTVLMSLTLIVTYAPRPVHAQTTPAPRLIFQASIPGINDVKAPDIATSGRLVHIGSNTNRLDAVYTSKVDTDQNFAQPQIVGEAPGQPDFSPVTVAAGLDGTVHIAWINQETRRLQHRSRPPGGDFGAINLIAASNGFPASINMGVSSDGTVFVAWREPGEPSRVSFSTNNGASWNGPTALTSSEGVGFPMLALGLNGQMAIAFTVGDAALDRLQVFVAVWNGSSFTTERVSPSDADYATPSVAIDYDGRMFVVYRGIENTETTGVWLAEKITGGWQAEQLSGRVNISNPVNIAIDAEGTQHVSWIADIGGPFYAYRPRGGSFSTPIVAPNPGGSIFSPRMDLTMSDDEVYIHIVTELFGGSGVTARYYLFASPSINPPAPEPVINDGNPFNHRLSPVAVRFDNVSSPPPAQIRYRWDAPPDDANTDSGGWVPFANPMGVTLPERILTTTACVPSTLFIQVRRESGAVSKITNDAVTFDSEVYANVTLINPFTSQRAPTFTPLGESDQISLAALGGDSGLGGASNGAIDYTRVPAFYLEVANMGDCSGIREFATGRSSTSFGPAVSLVSRSFANILPFPGSMTLGANEVFVRIADEINNYQEVRQTLIYDPAKPILASSTAESFSVVATDPRATVVQKLSIRDVTVVDNSYPGRGFWGVWIANSRTPIDDPASNPDLRWFAGSAPGTSGTFNLAWNAASGLASSEVTPGTYYIYLRFLDGAGNATDSVLRTSVTLEELSFPRIYLPLVQR